MDPAALLHKETIEVEVLYGFTDGDVAGREHPQTLLEGRLHVGQLLQVAVVGYPASSKAVYLLQWTQQTLRQHEENDILST